jgi:hypothetical protein
MVVFILGHTVPIVIVNLQLHLGKESGRNHTLVSCQPSPERKGDQALSYTDSVVLSRTHETLSVRHSALLQQATVLIILFLAVDAMRHCDLETNRASQLMWSICFVVYVPTVATQLTNNHTDAQFVKTKP